MTIPLPDRTDSPRLLVFAASTRTGSLNQRLALRAAAEADRLGAAVQQIDLADYPLPLFDPDLEREQGAPAEAEALARLLREQNGLLVATPEYNGAFPPLLKNTIDWVSRVERGLLADRSIGLMSASPGTGGGRRALALTRTWLQHMRADVDIEPFSLPRAQDAFGSGGILLEPHASELASFVEAVVAALRERQAVGA